MPPAPKGWAIVSSGISANFRQFPPDLAFNDPTPTRRAQAIEIVDESGGRIFWRRISAFSAISAGCFCFDPFP
jgi:hypothetical protein